MMIEERFKYITFGLHIPFTSRILEEPPLLNVLRNVFVRFCSRSNTLQSRSYRPYIQKISLR